MTEKEKTEKDRKRSKEKIEGKDQRKRSKKIIKEKDQRRKSIHKDIDKGAF